MMRRATRQAPGQPPLWQRNGGLPMSGVERNILDKNYQELRLMAQEALDDAILIGCSEEHVRDALHRLIDALTNSYAPRSGTVPTGARNPSQKVGAHGGE